MESCLKSRRHMCCVDLIFELDVGPWMKRDQKDALLRPGRKKGVARYYYLFFLASHGCVVVAGTTIIDIPSSYP